MNIKDKISILILVCWASFAFSQSFCDPITEDLKQVLALVFEPELKGKDSIILRNNLKTNCIEKALDKSKVKVWSEQKLFDNLYKNYYSLEEIQISKDIARVVYIQRNHNLMFRLLFFKENNRWFPVDGQKKWQARIKGDDFLLASIRREKLKSEKSN